MAWLCSAEPILGCSVLRLGSALALVLRFEFGALVGVSRLMRCLHFVFLEGSALYSCTRLSNNRSVMPLDVLGCTRATMERSTRFLPAPRGVGNPLKSLLNWDCGLQLFLMNEEFLVSVNHQFTMITSLPFVHTARRYYRLNDLVRPLDWRPRMGILSLIVGRREDVQTGSFRGSKSRNKVSVGEPAEGSLLFFWNFGRSIVNFRNDKEKQSV